MPGPSCGWGGAVRPANVPPAMRPRGLTARSCQEPGQALFLLSGFTNLAGLAPLMVTPCSQHLQGSTSLLPPAAGVLIIFCPSWSLWASGLPLDSAAGCLCAQERHCPARCWIGRRGKLAQRIYAETFRGKARCRCGTAVILLRPPGSYPIARLPRQSWGQWKQPHRKRVVLVQGMQDAAETSAASCC